MNIEERLIKLEKSNKNYKIILAVCICMFMLSAKDIFIKDEIRAKTIYTDTLRANWIEGNIGLYNRAIVVGDTTDKLKTSRIYPKSVYLGDIYMNTIQGGNIWVESISSDTSFSYNYINK